MVVYCALYTTKCSLVPSPTFALHFVAAMLEAEAVGWEQDYTKCVLRITTVIIL